MHSYKILWRGLGEITLLILIFLFFLILLCLEDVSAPIEDHRIGEVSSRIDQKKTPSCVKDPDIVFFMYHYIRDYDPRDTVITRDLSIPPAIFEEQMRAISTLEKSGAITLMHGDDFLTALRSGCFPGTDIWIFTADDGWIDMRDSLVPIATRYDVPFFLGIISGKLDEKGFLSTSDVRELSKNPLVTIASHSVRHIDNSKLSESEETHEMCDSRGVLEKITGKTVDTYIYPSGRMNPQVDATIAKKCGYSLAWSTQFGEAYTHASRSLYDINRLRITAHTDIGFFREILSKKVNATK